MEGKAIAPEERQICLEARQCRACGKYLISGNWRRLTLEEAAEKAVSGCVGRGAAVALSAPMKKKKHLEFSFTAVKNNGPPQHGLLKIYSMQCDFCSKRAGGYFEALLQVRSERASAEEDINKAMGIIESNAEGRDTILRFKEARHGFDVEIAPVAFANLLEKKFKAAGLSTRKTAKNVTRDNLASKDVYQVTVCARFPVYSIGDFVGFRGEAFVITSLGQKVVLLAEDGLEKRVEPEDFKEYSILPHSEGLIVSIRPPHMQVMDSDFSTFDAIVPRNFGKPAGAKVKIVDFSGKRLVF